MEVTRETTLALLGNECHALYDELNEYILSNYLMDTCWEEGGKYGKLCLRYRRSGKTLCTLYFRPGQLGVWIILGQKERAKYEEIADFFSAFVQEKYDATPVFHDGKWLMFDVQDDALLEDMKRLLAIKKKPRPQAAAKE